ncbi:DUF554 domain-containing protein [Granulicella cerasi]|uniref:DUF554 domain-containing protein n=1 Tax=Granulicella cerasi TaxID=741063 RepID=A0ABW1Z8U0_9BACT|nr:DUF554 domain-containing protein [Granulicella cerasi]
MKGPWIDSSSVLLGGLVGAALGKRVPERLRTALPMAFGLCSMGLGIALTVGVKHLAAMVLSLILGALIGELIFLEKGIGALSRHMRRLVDRVLPSSADEGESNKEYLQTFVAVLVLFCASGTGIFGAMKEGMTGDSSILIAKSLLDFFTAAIFATELGYAVAIIAVPQLLVQVALFFGATVILPLTNPMLIADFSAVGGLIMFATGLRICKIRDFAVANMLPALLLAMPLSALWTRIFHI